jgi:hypothetical protein
LPAESISFSYSFNAAYWRQVAGGPKPPNQSPTLFPTLFLWTLQNLYGPEECASGFEIHYCLTYPVGRSPTKGTFHYDDGV